MQDRYIKLKIEYVVNNLLYEKDVIDKNLYEQVSKRIDKLLFEENKKILLHHWLKWLCFITIKKY